MLSFSVLAVVFVLFGQKEIVKKAAHQMLSMVGMVAGGVASCGDKDIPGYYTRIDYPEIANFIQAPEVYSSTGNLKAK